MHEYQPAERKRVTNRVPLCAQRWLYAACLACMQVTHEKPESARALLLTKIEYACAKVLYT